MKKVVIGDGSLERQQIMEKKSIENDTSRSKEQSRRIVVVEDESREKNESNNKNQQQKRKIFGNDISRANDQQRKTTKFNITERGKKTVFSRINDAWRRHKYSIKRDHFLKYSSMKERLKNRPKSISEYHFKKLLVYWKDNHVQDKLQESIENSVEVGTQAFQSLFGKEKPGRISDMPQKMGAMEALLKSMYMQQNLHLSEEEIDDKMREALHNDNIPTPPSSTSTYAPAHQKFFKLLIKLMVRNKDDPQDEQDDDNLQYDQDDNDLQYDQDDDDLQYDQDDNDLQYDNFQDDDSHEPQHDEYDKDRH
ncbi:uncharacterized protein LOC127122571 [Lathyrus oleraceus]|uniref:uncharacterized protein LOC127122571 n=1 Tax=Pisum sativum TaxID=3888 RepID=UPI0021D371F2|nr:uncharacterized protein LOC127122571 [Pisum sativum]